jgi:hypothetical protein
MDFEAWNRLTPFVTSLQTQDVGSNWTMAYELLPRFDFLTLPNGSIAPFKDLYTGSFAPLLPALPRTADALPLAFALWDASETNKTLYQQAFAIIGSGRPTPGTIANDSKLGECNPTVDYVNGDETVPLLSAQASPWIPPANFRYVNEQHGLLPSNGAVEGAILRILHGTAPDNLTTTPIEAGAKHWTALGCSPIDLIASNSSGAVISATLLQIDEGQYYTVGGHKQIIIPEDTTNIINVVGAGTGKFSMEIAELLPNGTTSQVETFQQVPVTPSSTGAISLTPGSLGSLQYDYTGSGIVDVIPANVKPPTILCTECALGGEGKTTFSFDVGFRGSVSIFTAKLRTEGDDDKYRDSRALDFKSTRVTDIAVSDASAIFSGIGQLNGVDGFSFLVRAAVRNLADRNETKRPIDDVSIEVTGPNHFVFHSGGRLQSGNLVVHQ